MVDGEDQFWTKRNCKSSRNKNHIITNHHFHAALIRCSYRIQMRTLRNCPNNLGSLQQIFHQIPRLSWADKTTCYLSRSCHFVRPLVQRMKELALSLYLPFNNFFLENIEKKLPQQDLDPRILCLLKNDITPLEPQNIEE